MKLVLFSSVSIFSDVHNEANLIIKIIIEDYLRIRHIRIMPWHKVPDMDEIPYLKIRKKILSVIKFSVFSDLILLKF